METLLNKDDVKSVLGVSHRTVTRLIQSGQLTALKIGAQVRVRESDLQKYLDRQAKAGAAGAR